MKSIMKTQTKKEMKNTMREIRYFPKKAARSMVSVAGKYLHWGDDGTDTVGVRESIGIESIGIADWVESTGGAEWVESIRD